MALRGMHSELFAVHVNSAVWLQTVGHANKQVEGVVSRWRGGGGGEQKSDREKHSFETEYLQVTF